VEDGEGDEGEVCRWYQHPLVPLVLLVPVSSGATGVAGTGILVSASSGTLSKSLTSFSLSLSLRRWLKPKGSAGRKVVSHVTPVSGTKDSNVMNDSEVVNDSDSVNDSDVGKDSETSESFTASELFTASNVHYFLTIC
jgi:hypothetical protein